MYHRKYNYSKHKHNIKIKQSKWGKKTLRKTKVSSQKQLLVNNSTPTYKYLIKQVFLEDKKITTEFNQELKLDLS